MENGNGAPSPLIPPQLIERLTTPKAIGVIALVAFLLLSRLVALQIKPVQHDESMFAYYSWQVYDRTDTTKYPDATLLTWSGFKHIMAGYNYMPIMHGPFLEFVTAAVFYVFGDSDYTMRLGCAICGLFIFLSLYLLRNEIGRGRAWLAMLLIGLCPTFTYVTRYIRPDMYVIVMYIWAIHAGWRYSQTLRPWRLALFILIAWAQSMTHETYVIFYFFMITFGIGCWIHGCVHPEQYADEDFLPKGRGMVDLSPSAKLILRWAASIGLGLPLLYWLGWVRADSPDSIPYASTIFLGLLVLAAGEGAAWCVRRYQSLARDFPFLKALFPNKAVPFYRELRYALTYHWPVIVLSCLAGLFVTVAFHTSFYNFMNHKWGQFEAFEYWNNEHKGHRIKGEFHFHLIHLMIYEMPLLILFVLCCVRQMWAVEPSPSRSLRRGLFIGWLVVSFFTLHIPAFWTEVEGDKLWNCMLDERWYKLLHMTRGFHLYMFIQCLLVVFVTGWIHLNKGRVFHALCDYWFIGSFLAYNYAGEKVPWVGAHIVLPMMISCALYIWMIYEKWFVHSPAMKPAPATDSRKKDGARRKSSGKEPPHAPLPAPAGMIGLAMLVPSALGAFMRMRLSRQVLVVLGGVSFVWTAYVWTLLCFVQPGSPIERHTYASSHTEFHKRIYEVIDQCMDKYSGYDTPIAFGGEPGWPLNWILRDFRNKNSFTATPNPNDMYQGTLSPNMAKVQFPLYQPPGAGMAEPVFVILDNVIVEYWKPAPRFMNRYVWIEKVPFRHYWVPDPLKWDKMKKIWLLLRSPESLKDKPELLADRETCAKEWKKLLVAYFLRNEELTKTGGPYEWNALGGMNCYIGRLRSDLQAAQADPDQS